ncbi:exodeoxyribonuclease V subunit beta [Limnobacter sp.]|jgi:ATP-dependent helicase/nuclease subunit A|uniref:UvrD-helicase domain-containing protein n=1 Tax=Limnobacter sp. TaxID=2003368 RepID=UPI002732FCAC|nr:UvrD-helicase domain-containing protein [Limnobacter sp.]MDP3271505.1 UvrD-helicase domain-containing protein [Limnobacter sp.]
MTDSPTNKSPNDFTSIACNPANSVVVEACAGSGKTWLLTARLFRLLLSGARPDQILAITFTRKAAQEMQERLFGLLRECALLSDDKLSALLTERGAVANETNLSKARALAGEVLTNSRGVTIDTFHGWFASLCQMAPLASGFSRQSEPTDQTGFWMDMAIDVFTANLLNDQSELLPAFDTLASQMDRAVVRQVLQHALTNRVACSLWLHNSEAPPLNLVFGIDEGEQWPVEVLNNKHYLEQWQQAARWLALGTAKQQGHAVEIEKALTALREGGDAGDVFEQLKAVCLTAKNEPSKNFFKITAGQKTAVDETDYVQTLEGLALQTAQALQLEKDQLDMRATAALAQLIEPLFDTYKSIKLEQGLCDFDDLEATALRMLMNDEQRAYMQQKLDTRVRHLLVDEFQDTNPVQWNILKLWLQDYSGDDKPSVFLVGDPKQSIYRFRRAEARLFNHARTWLVENFAAKTLESDSTRRCAQSVVDVVNTVFEPGQTRGQTAFRTHTSLAGKSESTLSGLNVYPKLLKEEQGPDEAQRVVHTLQQWLANGSIQNLSEVMVLVRAHKSGVPLMAALREAGLAYTIKDKGERYTSQVWGDTIALLGFLNDPHANLHLLQLLRCPLIGLSSPQFQALIQAGKTTRTTTGANTVWSTLEALAGQHERPWANLHAQLSEWLRMARALPLFETLSKVVTDTKASEKYLNSASPRQRVMMAEHWDWLKAWALGLNKGRFPSLQHALDEAVKLQTYASSDSEGAANNPDVLRIMTVHSAKGLEANHVWLFDANSSPKPGGSNAGLLIDWALGESHPNSVTVMGNLSNPSPGRASAQTIEQQAYADEEDHLLYVALTRARYSIHLSGSEKRGANKGWYERLLPFASLVHNTWPTFESAINASDEARQGPAQIELAGLFDPPAVWVRPQFPVLKALNAPVGKVVPRITTPELRKGTAWHAALEWVDELFDVPFDTWWARVLVRCEAVFRPLRDDELLHVEQACRLLVDKADLQPWLQGAVVSNNRVFNELEWVLGDGRSLRADRVLELSDRFLVLDYKWAVNAGNLEGYTQQVLEYVGLVDLTLNKGNKLAPTQAALIDRHGEVHWLTSV